MKLVRLKVLNGCELIDGPDEICPPCGAYPGARPGQPHITYHRGTCPNAGTGIMLRRRRQ